MCHVLIYFLSLVSVCMSSSSSPSLPDVLNLDLLLLFSLFSSRYDLKPLDHFNVQFVEPLRFFEIYLRCFRFFSFLFVYLLESPPTLLFPVGSHIPMLIVCPRIVLPWKATMNACSTKLLPLLVKFGRLALFCSIWCFMVSLFFEKNCLAMLTFAVHGQDGRVILCDIHTFSIFALFAYVLFCQGMSKHWLNWNWIPGRFQILRTAIQPTFHYHPSTSSLPFHPLTHILKTFSDQNQCSAHVSCSVVKWFSIVFACVHWSPIQIEILLSASPSSRSALIDKKLFVVQLSDSKANTKAAASLLSCRNSH